MTARILFVDDEPKVIDAHRRSFRRYKDVWTIRYATSGVEALALLEDEPADVVVSDLAMPGMQGLELVSAIESTYPETQCIILTGTADMQSTLHATNDVDVFRFYLKPCAVKDLGKGIEDALQAAASARRKTDVAADASLDIGKAALDTLPYGVFVVSPDARVLFVNTFATELLNEGEGMRVDHDGKLRAGRPGDSEALQGAVGRVASPAIAERAEVALFIGRESGERPLFCVVQPFADVSSGGDPDRHVAVFVTDPEKAPSVAPQILAGMFDLTQSESRLLSHLVASGRLEQAAEDAKLTLSTARTYLKQIFSKTGTSRQGELIQMVLLSPAVVKRAS